MPRRVVGLICAIALPVIGLPSFAAAQSSSPVVYVVLGGEGPVARAIVIPPAADATAQCPTISVDGSEKPMGVRAPFDTKAGAAFPVLVCEYLLQDAKSASIGGQELPLPKASVSKIAVLGDTGCRLKARDDDKKSDTKKAAAPEGDDDDDDDDGDSGKAHKGDKAPKPPKSQDCNNQSKWPFASMSATIAAANPDLVVHVGDYIYRETACPPRDPKCTLTPYGDTWATWEVDFFAPAAPLLQAAPWIVVRGNHENCKRAGNGYALFLDPTPLKGEGPPACEKLINQYGVTAGGRNFIVLDSSKAEDECPDNKCDAGPWAAQFAAMKPVPGTWLVTHRPIWGFTTAKDKSGKSDETADKPKKKSNKDKPDKPEKRKLVIRNMTLQAALDQWGGKPPPGIDLVLSGHIHLWEALSFADGRSPQFVLGSGGTKLAHDVKQKLKGRPVGGTTVASASISNVWGYTLFEPSKHGKRWNAVYFGVDSKQQVACKVRTGTLSCDK